MLGTGGNSGMLMLMGGILRLGNLGKLGKKLGKKQLMMSGKLQDGRNGGTVR